MIGTPHLETILVSSSRATILPRQTQECIAKLLDQYGDPYPGTVIWSVNAGGSIDQSGLFTSNGNGTEEVSPAFNLSQGSNLIVIKLIDGCCGNHFAVRLTDTAGKDISGLVYRLFSDSATPARYPLTIAPSKSRAQLTIEVCDLSGACVKAISGHSGASSSITIPTSNLSKGIYFVRVRSGTFSTSSRFIVAH